MLVAADNISAARATVRRALETSDAQTVAALCRRVEAAGARWLDLNPGYLPPARREHAWRFLIQTAESACGLRLILDAPEPQSLAVAVGMCQRPPVLNMATAEPARLEAVLDLAASHPGTVAVAATITATVPATAEERLELASMIMAQAAARSIGPERVVLDPMVMPLALAGGEDQAREVIRFLRALPQVFDPAPRTMAAVSNLVTKSAGKETGFAAGPFLAAAWGAGLDIAMMDALDPELRRVVGLCRVFAGKRVFAPGEFA